MAFADVLATAPFFPIPAPSTAQGSHPSARTDEAVSSPPKPPATRIWNIRDGKIRMSVEFVPGIPEPGKVVEVTVRLSEMPKQRHPRFGHRIPI